MRDLRGTKGYCHNEEKIKSENLKGPVPPRAKSPDGQVRTYFGRYALCLQVDPFSELLEQARKKGYFQD